jgi:hypothetical protein
VAQWLDCQHQIQKKNGSGLRHWVWFSPLGNKDPWQKKRNPLKRDTSPLRGDIQKENGGCGLSGAQSAAKKGIFSPASKGPKDDVVMATRLFYLLDHHPFLYLSRPLFSLPP